MFVGAVLMLAACDARSDAPASQETGGNVDLSANAPGQSQGDALAQRADSLVRAGRAWRATALLAPRLVTPSSAPPEIRLAGARAAAEWAGWSEVERVLRDATWLDQQFGGDGRELLVRAELERKVDALPDARLALTAARDDASRMTRRVLLARAHDRAGARDSAATHYLAAAARLPRIADWLRLRAAGVTDDSAARAALFAKLASAPVKARVGATDAQAREGARDLAGAARAFRRAGDEGSAFRVEAIAARDDASKAALARRIVAYLRGSPPAAEARQMIEVLDNLGALPSGDELVVARAAAGAGSTARAITGFTRATAQGPLTAADRMTYAATLSRAGRAADAARMYATLADDPALAPLAAYQRARSLVQAGQQMAARAALREVAEKYASMRAAAAPALLLLADLQVDDGDLAGASQSLHALTSKHPTASQAPLARFRAALLDWNASPNAPAAAAAAFDSLATLHPTDEEALAARYWAGRAYEKLGRKGLAEERWKGVIAAEPLSYYAMRSARRLDTASWSAPTGLDTASQTASVDSAIQRVRTLRRLGMDVEARFEIDALAARAHAEAPAVAQALLAVEEPSRAMRVALSAIDRGAKERMLYRIAYPVVHDDVLLEESKRNGLDPALVAGLIRQESSWNPRAISPATARGLMQLMPAVGASIAASKKYPLWNQALLLEPDVSLELGTSHLASSLRRDTPPERALAAYNAGASRVARWVQRPGADDAELFTEWIPFTETRDYVRVVLRNASVYRALYDLR